MRIRRLIPVVVVACGQTVASAEATRPFGTIDSFGLLRWERFSSNPAVGTIVAALAKARPTLADLQAANATVAKKPDDLPSRALRAELRLKADPSASRLPAPTYASLVRMKKPDQFEASYLFYHRRRTELPERYGITTDWNKASPPYGILNQHELVTVAMSSGGGDLTLPEEILLLDWSLRFGVLEDSRRTVRHLLSEKPQLWELEALKVFALRQGALHGPWNATTGVFEDDKADPDRIRRPDLALALARSLIGKHPECRVLNQAAGVAAMDLKRYELARAYFNAYLARPDSGVQGERRSEDVRALLAKLPK